jgi:hypothetical protein
MSEAVTAIEALSGKRVLVLAPSSASVEVLRAQGFTNAEMSLWERMVGKGAALHARKHHGAIYG